VSERRVILEWILRVDPQYLSVRIRLVRNLVILDSVMKFQMSFHAENFLAKIVTIVFLKRKIFKALIKVTSAESVTFYFELYPDYILEFGKGGGEAK